MLKLRESQELEKKINNEEKLTINDVPFSEQWLEEQNNFHENPFNDVLFKKYREELLNNAQQGKTKAFFKPNEEVELKHDTILYVVRILQHYNLYGVDEDISGKVFEVFLNATVRG